MALRQLSCDGTKMMVTCESAALVVSVTVYPFAVASAVASTFVSSIFPLFLAIAEILLVSFRFSPLIMYVVSAVPEGGFTAVMTGCWLASHDELF